MNNNFELMLQAALDRVKSLLNIKSDIKAIEPKLPKIKVQGTLDSQKTKSELTNKLKNTTVKIKVDADTKLAESKIEKLTKDQKHVNITPRVDNSQLSSDFKTTEKQTQSFLDEFTNNIAGLNVLRIAFYKIAEAASKALKNVKDLDIIKTNIQAASQVSNTEADSMMKTYNQMGKELSSTTKKVAESADEFIRMGESVSSTNELIKNAQMLSTLGKIDNSDAASYIISAMKGYQIAAQDSIRIVDKLTSVDMEAAISAGGLAEALSKTSNIASSSSVSLDRLISYVSVVGETTQKSMSEVGNSFQSIFSRMNNIKINRFIDDETGDSLSDTETVLNKLGIKLRDTEDTYRDFDDVLDDVGKKWSSFTQKEQNAISVAVAGTRQRENFMALMNRYGDALKYAEVAANSSGTAMKRYEQYQDSIDAKTNRLTNSLEALSMNTISEDLYKDILEATTGIIEFTDKTNLLKGSLAGLATYGASKMFVAMASGIISAAKSTTQLTSVMAMFNNVRNVENLKAIGMACQGLTDKQMKLVLSTTGLTNMQRLLILQGKGVEESQRQQTLTTLGFSQAENTATASTFSFAGALNTLKAAFASNPVGIAITAVTTAVSIGTMAYSKYKQSVEKAKQAASDAADRIESLSSELQSNQKTISDSAKRFAELSQGIDALTGKNVSLSDSDYQEFLSISNDLAKVFPTLSRNYDENGNAIVNLSGNVDTIVSSLQDLIEAQRDLTNSQIADELPTVFKGAATKSDSYKAELDDLEQQRDALINSLENVQSNDFADNFIDGISKRWLTVSSDNLDDLSQMKSDYEKLLKEANIDFETLTPNYKTNEYGQEIPVDFTFNITSSDEDIENAKKTIDKGVQELASQYEKDITKLNTDIANTNNKNKSNWSSLSGSIAAWLSSDSSYKVMSDSMQSSVQQIINNLDWTSLDFSSWDDAEQYVQDNIIGLFEGVDGTNIAKQFGKAFDLKTQFQSGEVTLDEYLKGVSGFKSLIDGFDDNTKKSIDFIFSVSSSDGSSVDSMMQGVEDKLQESAIENVGELSLGDLEIAFDKIEVPEGTLLSWEDLLDLINKYKESVKATPDFTTLFSNLPIDKVEEYVSLVKSGNIDKGTISSFSELNDLMSQTGMNAEDAAKALKDYADGFTLSTDLTANIQDSYDLLQDVEEQYSKTKIIGLSSLESIVEKYPKLRSAVNEYTQGLINADDVLAQLHTAYDNDAAAYRVSMANRLSTSKEFFKSIVSNNQALFDNLSAAYGFDVNNWKTMAQAKAEIDQKLIQNLSSAWSKYYNIVFDSASGMASFAGQDIGNGSSHGSTMSVEQQKAWSEANKQANKYNQLMNKFNEAANIQIDAPDFGGIGSVDKTGSDKKKKEDSQNEIDWIARKTKLMQDEYSKLEELANKDTVAYLGLTQEQFDKAKSIFDNGLGNTNEGLSELQSYADKAGLSLGELYTMIQSGAPGASKENALQSMLKMQTETLLPQYQQEVEAYSKAYADAIKAVPEYKDKIEKGGVDIETIPSDLAEKVQKAIDANDKLKTSEKQLSDGEQEHVKRIKELHENRINSIDAENEKLEQSNKIIKSQIALMEARGEIVDADFYKRQMKNNKGLISGNQKDISEWESEMADLRAAKVSTDSKEYKDLQAKIKGANSAINDLKLDQEEFNQKLEQMPIDNLNTVISMYKDISSTIEQWGNVTSATGEKLNADYYQELISNGATTIDQYKELASEIENVMDEQKEGSTRWNELCGQLQSVNSEMSSMVQNLKKWNEELLKMPLENISNYSSELQKVADGLNGVKSEYDTTISAVTGAISEQIKAINEQKDAVNKEYDASKKALQDKLDLMDKQNKKLQLQQKYEQALYNLQMANQQATEKVIRDGQVVYEQNADKIRDAQDAVQDAKFDMETSKIQAQIDELQETLDGLNEKYQDQIDSLQKISEKWSEISEKITQAQNEAKATDLLGVGWKDKVLSGKDVELFNNFSGMYANTAEQLRQYQEQINTTNNIYSLLEDYINSYKEGTLSYDQALTGINNLLAQMNQTMSAEGNIQNIYDYLGAMNGTAANAENVLSGIKQGLANTATELIDSFKQYNQNAGLISEYTSSWQQLTDNVSSMLHVLEEVRDNLESASDGNDDEDDDDGAPFRKGSSGYVNSGPGVKAYKNGIENGLVGTSSTSDREAKMKLLGLKNMDQDEIPAILHKNEAVFNPDQQDMLLKNLVTAWNFAPSKIDYSSLSSNRSNLTTQEFKFGNINIQECNNAEELAQGILNGGLKRAIIQQSGKR